REIVRDVANGDERTMERLWKPERNAGSQEDERAADNGPEIRFLSRVEEVDVFRLARVGVDDVVAELPHPAVVVGVPRHRAPPVQELQREAQDEAEAEPRMEQTRHRAAPEERSQQAEEPRRVDCETGQR